METKAYHRYQLGLENRKISSIEIDGKKTNRFMQPDAQNKLPKLYVIKSGSEVIYIGQTTQGMQTRIRQGLKAKGDKGYWGYKWRGLRRVEVLVWCFPGKSAEYVEAIEGELVFLFRKHKGRWPKYQMEIHFHNRVEDAVQVAQSIFERCVSQSNVATKPWGNPGKAKILVIGHDPRLQKASTIANYCFYADYFFQPKPDRKSDLAKYQLAEALYQCIRVLTDGCFHDDEILITNLCNEALPHSPKGKTVLIPKGKAEEGLKNIRVLLEGSKVRLIFAMSQQVNYWLQKLGFYATNTGFLEQSEPKGKGVNCKPPYYEPRSTGAFKEICGKNYSADNEYALFPILHIKNYPLKGKFQVYQRNYENCKEQIQVLVRP